MDSFPLLHDSDAVAPVAPIAIGTASAVPVSAVSAARAAGLKQLARLWRADEIAPAGTDDTIGSGFAALDAELPGGGWPLGQLTELLLDAPGIGELSLLAPVLACCTRDARACVWVLPCERAAPAVLPALPHAPALAAAGIDLARALFVQPETPREAFWAIEQSLRAAHLGALIAWLPPAPASEGVRKSSRAARDRDEQRTRTEEYGEQRSREIGSRSRFTHALSREGEFRALRRLQLLAGRQQAPVFLLRETRTQQAPSPAALRLQLAAGSGELAVTILKRRGRPLLEPVTLQVHPLRWQGQTAAVDEADAARPQPAGLLQQAALLAQRWSTKVIFSH